MPVWSGYIAGVSDDAEQLQGTTTVNTTGGTLDLGRDTVGLRFTGVTVPRNAVISDATLDFTANASDSAGSVSLLVDGEAVDSAATFTTAANSIHSRTGTTATATFALTAWTSATIYRLQGNLKNIIQEIVNRTGWASGNALVLRLFDSGSSTGRRRAYSRNGTAVLAELPTLTITYAATDVVLEGNVGVATVVPLAGQIVPGPATVVGNAKVVNVVTLQGAITEDVKLEGNVGMASVVRPSGSIVPGPASVAGNAKAVAVTTLRGRIHYNIYADRTGVAGGGALVDIYR